MTKNEFLNYLHMGDFGQLFRECFWDKPTTTAAYTVTVSGVEAAELRLSFCEVAQKKGYGPSAIAVKRSDADLDLAGGKVHDLELQVLEVA